MSICKYCGDEIEFRMVGGAVVPIHINGGWCPAGSGTESTAYARSSFREIKSYLDPNATCPLCGAPVFFYRSRYNGRVFFDDVGWPWPKHRCTDKYRGDDKQITRAVRSRYKFNFKSREGKSLDVCLADQFIEREAELIITLRNAERGARILIVVSRADMIKNCIEIADIREAPSFVMPRERGSPGETEVSFLCARLQSVVTLPAKLHAEKK